MSHNKNIDINKLLKEFSGKLPRFPDGRIDYTNSDRAPVLSCFVEYDGLILLLKRSDKVLAYHGKWNSVAGFIDKPMPLYDLALIELKEELGIYKKIIKGFKTGKPYNLQDKSIGKTWIVHPMLAELTSMPKIKLDWEHTDYKWIDPKDIKKYDIIPKLDKALKSVLK